MVQILQFFKYKKPRDFQKNLFLHVLGTNKDIPNIRTDLNSVGSEL